MAKFNQNVYNHIKAVGGSEASAQNADELINQVVRLTVF